MKVVRRFCRLVVNVLILLVVFAVPARAQQPTKVWRIAWVTAASTRSMIPRIEVFRAGLRELG